MSIITKILGVLPGIGTLLEKFGFGEDKELEKLKAEAELADIKGFYRTGRISAKHFWNYTKSFLVIMLVLYLGAAIFFPDIADGFDDLLGSIVDSAKAILEIKM